MKKKQQEYNLKPITNADERQAYIGSRHQVLDRSWVTSLWMQVITKAKEDLALFIRMYEDGEDLSDEDKFYADTAYNFLFVEEYTISLGDIEVTLEELLRNWRNIKSMKDWRKRQWKDIRKKVTQKRKALRTRRERQQEKHAAQRRTDAE